MLGRWKIDDETLDFFAQIATPSLIRKILKVIPYRQFDFRDMVTQLDIQFLGDRPVELLKKAQEYFEKGLFEDAAINATMAGERMLESFGYYLKEFGIEISGPMAGNRLEQSRKGLFAKVDPAGRTMGAHERLEWYLLSLFETINLFRNLIHHEAENMPKLPEWMGTDRTNKKNSAEHARHILITSLQAAIELQLLMKHKTESLAPAS